MAPPFAFELQSIYNCWFNQLLKSLRADCKLETHLKASVGNEVELQSLEGALDPIPERRNTPNLSSVTKKSTFHSTFQFSIQSVLIPKVLEHVILAKINCG